MVRSTIIVAVTVALALPLAASARPSATKLTGTVGPGFTITLKKAGKNVKTLPAGSYTITVIDRSADHNFHIRGPRVNRNIGGVEFVGRKTVTLTFRKGLYRFVCDPHAEDMRGSFRVT